MAASNAAAARHRSKMLSESRRQETSAPVPAPAPVTTTTHTAARSALDKIYAGEPDDRRINIEQLARHAGITHEQSADYVHGMVKRKIAEYDYMSESDAAHNAQFAPVHRDPDTGRAVAGFRVFRHGRLGEMAAHAPAVSPAPPSSVSHTHVDLPTFATRVKEAAHAVGEGGRFGSNKVFISHAYNEYTKRHGPIPVHEFKAQLGAAVQARHLDLSRADLVEAMNPAHVQASETKHPSGAGEFHFIRVDPARKKKI